MAVLSHPKLLATLIGPVRGHGVAVLSQTDDARGSFEETFFNNNHSILVIKINVKSTTSENCRRMEQLSRNF